MSDYIKREETLDEKIARLEVDREKMMEELRIAHSDINTLKETIVKMVVGRYGL